MHLLRPHEEERHDHGPEGRRVEQEARPDTHSRDRHTGQRRSQNPTGVVHRHVEADRVGEIGWADHVHDDGRLDG
jgi:hypothetical protein